MEWEHPFFWFIWEAWKGFWFFVAMYFPIWLAKAGRWSSLWADGK